MVFGGFAVWVELRRGAARMWPACNRIAEAPRLTAIAVGADQAGTILDRSDASLGQVTQRCAAADTANLHSAVTQSPSQVGRGRWLRLDATSSRRRGTGESCAVPVPR